MPLLKVEARKLFLAMLRGSLDTLILLSLPVTTIVASHSIWESRYSLALVQQQKISQWAQVSMAVARLEDVPPITPLVLWYKEGGLQASNPDNCEGIMGLHSAVSLGQLPCFEPGPIDAWEVARQLQLGAAIFKEHCPEVTYSTTDPELLKRCYLYYNAGRHTRLSVDRSGYVMNGYDAAHQNMIHRSDAGTIVRLQALGAWPVHLAILALLARNPSLDTPSLLLPPALSLQEAKDRLWTKWARLSDLPAAPAEAPRCRAPVLGECFGAPHDGGDTTLRPAISPLLAPIGRGSELVCDLLPGIDLEAQDASIILAPMDGQLLRYADQWGHLALRIENAEWIVWLTGLRSYTISPGAVEAGQPVGAIGGIETTTPAVHLAVFDKTNTTFVDPMAFLPAGSCPASYQSLDSHGQNKEEAMNILALLPFAFAILGLAWAVWLFFKKDILSKGVVSVITYFIGVIIALWFIGWLVDAFLPQWIAQRLVTAQQSESIDTIEQISRDILNETMGTPSYITVVEPEATPTPEPTVSPLPTGEGTEPSMDVQPGQLGPGERIHVVQQGEGLYRIAQQYGVSWPDIQERNNLANPNAIYPGQELIIPAP